MKAQVRTLSMGFVGPSMRAPVHELSVRSMIGIKPWIGCIIRYQ
jgi:hypothetical protein